MATLRKEHAMTLVTGMVLSGVNKNTVFSVFMKERSAQLVYAHQSNGSFVELTKFSPLLTEDELSLEFRAGKTIARLSITLRGGSPSLGSWLDTEGHEAALNTSSIMKGEEDGLVYLFSRLTHRQVTIL